MLKRDIIIGLLASLVPIYLMSTVCQQKSLKCPQVGLLVVTFVLLNVILLPLLRGLGITNYIYLGMILSIVYSSIGRFVGKVNEKIFEIEGNLFQLIAVALWAIVYFAIGVLLS